MNYKCQDCGSFNVVECSALEAWVREGIMLVKRRIFTWKDGNMFYAKCPEINPIQVGIGRTELEAINDLKKATLQYNGREILGEEIDET